MKNESVFLDTNVFLRYLTNDIPEQADQVEKLIQQAAQGQVALITNSMVLAEIVWVLQSHYGLPRTEIKPKLLGTLNTPGLDVVDKDLILQAIVWWDERNVDFIDAYNAAWILNRGMTRICTFDRKHFARIQGLTVASPTEIIVLLPYFKKNRSLGQ